MPNEEVIRFRIRTWNEATQKWEYKYPETSGNQIKLDDGSTVQDHVNDTERHFTPEEKAAITDKEDTANKGVANGYASLGADGKIPSSQLPAIAITDTETVSSQAEMLALDAEKGDVCVRTDLNKSFILKAEPATELANWQELLTPPNAVLSVNSQTGAVTLTTTEIEEGDKKYYTEARVSANADVAAAKTHTGTAHAPANAQKNSDITKAEIEAKLTGAIDTHWHGEQVIITNDLSSITNPKEGQIVFEVI